MWQHLVFTLYILFREDHYIQWWKRDLLLQWYQVVTQLGNDFSLGNHKVRQEGDMEMKNGKEYP